MRLMSGVQLVVDGQPVDVGETLSYRGMMYSGVPNLASSFGYTNASWTLKCELIAAMCAGSCATWISTAMWSVWPSARL